MSHESAKRRRTPLAEKLTERIRRSGPITVSEYMDACLYDPDHGYYSTHADVIGRDFITAPEISQMFGELIGAWCIVVWQQMGRPGRCHLVELGPGRGTMMRDLLRAARQGPDFLAAVQVEMVETSGPLAARQRSLLANAPVPITWHSQLPSAFAGPCIIVANEFLDVMPTSQYVRTGDTWFERAVGVAACGELQFTEGGRVDESLGRVLDDRFPPVQGGDIVEVGNFQLPDWLAAQAGREVLAALLIDYGHTQSGAGDTLQAMRGNRYEHPLCSPGEADLTVHVDFAELRCRLEALPALACDGPVPQAEFLGALGLVERASHLMAANPGKAVQIETAAQRLLAPGGMGTRFKAIGARSRELPALAGLGVEHTRTRGLANPC